MLLAFDWFCLIVELINHRLGNSLHFSLVDHVLCNCCCRPVLLLDFVFKIVSFAVFQLFSLVAPYNVFFMCIRIHVRCSLMVKVLLYSSCWWFWQIWLLALVILPARSNIYIRFGLVGYLSILSISVLPTQIWMVSLISNWLGLQWSCFNTK